MERRSKWEAGTARATIRDARDPDTHLAFVDGVLRMARRS